MKDAPSLATYLNDYLAADIATEVEDQIVSGSGTGENLLGILNASGVQTAGPPGAGESVLHVLREAKRLVLTNGRTTPTAIALNPTDAEALDLLEVNDEENRFVTDPTGSGLRQVSGDGRGGDRGRARWHRLGW